MNNLRTVFRVTKYQFLQLTRNPRLYMIVICNFIFLSSVMVSLRFFLEMYEIKATPFLFCFLFTHASVIFCFFAGIIFLYSNAPFFGRSQMFLAIRTGKVLWTLGQILYLLVGSAFYFFLLYVMSCAFLFPYISFQNEWGSVWNTLARTDLGINNGVTLIVSADLLNHFTPLEVLGWTCLMGVLNAILIGLVLFFCNVFFRREVGITMTVLLILLAYRLSFMPDFLHYIATVAWIDPIYLLYDPLYRGPNGIQQVCILIGMIVILIIGCIYGVLYRDIPEVEE